MSISLIPESAPFTPDQRAWLNGFLAGWIGLPGMGGDGDEGVTSAAGLATAIAPSGALPAPVVEAEPKAEDYPWHDPALKLDDRLKLAEGKPLDLRLMAAMAQLDCGSCGYLCKTYSSAIASGEETSLTLCSPGGSETSRAVKKLLKEPRPAAVGNGVGHRNGHETIDAAGEKAKVEPATVAWSRKNPYAAKLLRSENLSGEGSDKEIRHVEIDLGADGPSYEVGDSLGIFPTNCQELAEAIIHSLGGQGDELVSSLGGNGATTTLLEALVHQRCLTAVPEDVLQILADAATDPAEATQIRALIDDDAAIDGCDAFDILRLFPSARPAPAEFVGALAHLKPRLYSISSSPKRHVGQVHLTVRKVTYPFKDRSRKGVASTMLADRVSAGDPLRVFIQKSHGFTVPADPDAPIIMVGPGTGIAPFRAFLHERDATRAKGHNWLFFGDQRAAVDFLYEAELKDFLARGLLTRLDLAFSRDQKEKVYVQDRMRENGRELFDWLERGASVYVCGDAKRMAADVDEALREIVRVHGQRDEAGAKTYVASLASSGRYRRDVY